ncbi:MAG: glycoside hydrolase, partial [Oscillospiraceae bacterium]|nr:glycoside hydrolase [Oscillospiraceae bacterium]
MPKLSNPNADRNAQILYDYICKVQGNYVLTGQQEFPDNRRAEFEMRYLREVTGKLPAIRGLDYMGGEFENVNRRSLEWHKNGGIVSICWHTGINGYAYR